MKKFIKQKDQKLAREARKTFLGRNQPVLKQPKLNFKANPDGPYSTTLAFTSPLLPTTYPPPLTTKPTTDPDRQTIAISKLKNSPPHEKDFEIITDRLEKRCDDLKEELESFKNTIIDYIHKKWDENTEMNIKTEVELGKTNTSVDKLIESVNEIRNDFDRIRNDFELLTSRLDICEEKLDAIEKGCEPVKTKIDPLTETLLKDGFNETQNQSVKYTKDESKIV